MKLSELKLNMVVQGVTIASVLAGVAFVSWELEQNRELVRLEMFSEGTIANRATDLALSGENPAVVLAKACEGVEPLSTEDLMILNFVFTETLDSIRRMRLLENGLYPQDAWQGNLMNSGGFSFIFSMAAGRAWWQTLDPLPAIAEPINSYLAGLGPPDCAERHAEWKAATMAILSQAESH